MLIEKIKLDMFTAKKAGDKVRGTLLNTLYGEASKVGKDQGNRLTTDAETIAVIKKFINNSEEFIKSLKQQPLLDEKQCELCSTLENEIKILNEYLPKQLDSIELKRIMISYRNTKHDEGQVCPTMGEYMKLLKDHHAGLYDGKVAVEIAKSL